MTNSNFLNQDVIQKESETVTQQSKEQPGTTDMSDLQSEESAAQRRNQPGQGL